MPNLILYIFCKTILKQEFSSQWTMQQRKQSWPNIYFLRSSYFVTSALISVLLMVLSFMSHINILCEIMVQSLPRGTEEKALWVWQMVVVKWITRSAGNSSSAYVAPLCEVQCCRSGRSAYFLELQTFVWCNFMLPDNNVC
jgi:hypothetical protein